MAVPTTPACAGLSAQLALNRLRPGLPDVGRPTRHRPEAAVFAVHGRAQRLTAAAGSRVSALATTCSRQHVGKTPWETPSVPRPAAHRGSPLAEEKPSRSWRSAGPAAGYGPHNVVSDWEGRHCRPALPARCDRSAAGGWSHRSRRCAGPDSSRPHRTSAIPRAGRQPECAPACGAHPRTAAPSLPVAPHGSAANRTPRTESGRSRLLAAVLHGSAANRTSRAGPGRHRGRGLPPAARRGSAANRVSRTGPGRRRGRGLLPAAPHGSAANRTPRTEPGRRRGRGLLPAARRGSAANRVPRAGPGRRGGRGLLPAARRGSAANRVPRAGPGRRGGRGLLPAAFVVRRRTECPAPGLAAVAVAVYRQRRLVVRRRTFRPAVSPTAEVRCR